MTAPADPPAADRSPVAALAGVTHRYGDTHALGGVSVTIPRSRTVGLIGPDGVGKSTLLALVSGVRTIQTGRVTALDGDMADAGHRAAVCARIAYMPQGLGRNLYPTLSVVENIDFFGRLFGQSREERAWRIAELLEATALAPFPDRPAGKLSGGMKQKLSLCCSLIHDPDLLILDEPTTGVDPLSRKQFWELIERIRARRPGMSVITATAYMEEARRFDHLIAMDAGRILAEGTPAEIVARAGKESLEQAFVSLLPPERRRNHHAIVLPPLARDGREPAIEAQNLTKRFGDFTAVDDVTISVSRGEIFGFLGSNGCGKTTTMKMLTGLLKPTSGTARVLGQVPRASDIETRKRVGYMSQSFSLYFELTVRQNLELHAHLFAIPAARIPARVAEMLDRFELQAVADSAPESLPLGQRQRLQLAVAVIHGPEMLILDEPTSGVDPIARDRFWEMLIDLSRKDGVTIFLSTHFINEAERCDRVSLMHAGRILAVGTPAELSARRSAADLETAFIGYLEDAAGAGAVARIAGAGTTGSQTGGEARGQGKASSDPNRQPTLADRLRRWIDPGRIWAFARREAMELARDPIRIAFALLGPLALSIAMSYGISFDIEELPFAVLDSDRSQESRSFVDTFSRSRYFVERPPLGSLADVDQRLTSGDIRFAIVVPPDYGRDLLSGRRPDVGVWLDGSDTFRAETARGYVQGVLSNYLSDLARRETGIVPVVSAAATEVRFLYNQAFLSQYAITPGVLMMVMMMFCAMLTALGIVREKELGSITNLYAAPATRLEFLLGKQLPYIGIGMTTFASLVVLMHFGFGVPLKGNVATLVAGAMVYACACTAFGLVVSSFVRSQIAAIFGTAIIVTIPTINFSGMLYPVSVLEGGAKVIGEVFPALYFQRISAGVFNKGLGFADLWPEIAVLAGFAVGFIALAALLLKKQEA